MEVEEEYLVERSMDIDVFFNWKPIGLLNERYIRLIMKDGAKWLDKGFYNIIINTGLFCEKTLMQSKVTHVFSFFIFACLIEKLYTFFMRLYNEVVLFHKLI